MIKTGGRRIAFSETFIAFENELTNIEAGVDGGTLKMELSFSEEALPDNSPLTWKTTNGIIHLNFHGIQREPVPRIIQKPIKIGMMGEEKIGFTASVHHLHQTYLVHFQIMIGGEYHE
jgi:hypothetical protein